MVFPDVDRVVNLNVVKNFCFSTNIMNPLWPLSSLKNVTALLALADNHCSQLIPKPSSCHQDMTSGWGFGHQQSLKAQDCLYQLTCQGLTLKHHQSLGTPVVLWELDLEDGMEWQMGHASSGLGQQ